MLIQDRIKLIIKSDNLSASEFAAKIDVKRSNLSHVLSGRNKPSLDFLEKIIVAYPKVNASWLITGETREGSFEGTTEPRKDPQHAAQKTVEATSGKEAEEKEIKKIVVVYTDDTFDTLLPNAQ